MEKRLMLCSTLFVAYLRIQRWRLEAELVNVGEKRSIQLLAGCWHIQTALPLLFRHNFCIAWGSCQARANHVLTFSRILYWAYSGMQIETRYSVSPSGLSGRPMPSQLMLHWLLTLEVREPKGWRGMVPMTRGRFKDRFIAPGMST